MLVTTYRDDEIGPQHPLRFVIGDLPRASTRRIQLEPLSEVAVAQLASEAERPSKGLHGITGGNPFFVTELLASTAEAVPVTVRDAVLARAARYRPPHGRSRRSSPSCRAKPRCGWSSNSVNRARWTWRTA